MSLVKSTVALYNKYKKELVLLILVFFAYNIFIYYNQMKEGLVGATSCTQFTNCSQCVNGQVNNSNSPCYWSNQEKKCGSFRNPGYKYIKIVTKNKRINPMSNILGRVA